eukprot:TRINITY_DN27101_c0_g1_i2.p1 TRINITY_DN27101_c0_g1~~TRINITY_DN27101_c0_g1_i2.p1  ORF type:complete len:132 (+),score=37.36 TRINITY_DN27101_c0_g1_i2:20-415(+)
MMSFISHDAGAGAFLDGAGNRTKRQEMTEEQRQQDNRRRKLREKQQREKRVAIGLPPRLIKDRPLRIESKPPPLEADGAGFLQDEEGQRIARADMTPEQKKEDNKRRRIRERMSKQQQAEEGGENFGMAHY